MRKLHKYIWPVGIIFIVVAMLSAQPQDNKNKSYYSSHESELLPDAQTAFRNANYERAEELFGWYYIIVGNKSGEEMKDKAARCIQLSAEMKELEAAGNMEAALQKAKSILTLNPYDSYASRLYSEVLTANIAIPTDLSGNAAKYYPDAVKGDARSQYLLGDCYYYGTGARQDYTEAVKWYRKAAEQGYAVAQSDLGYCYKKGVGVDQNLFEAVKWLRKAADQGNADAQYNLGSCYAEGKGVEQNYSEAAMWYRKAADQGNAAAQNNLGHYYYNGLGVEQNYSEALKLFRKSAELGSVMAQRNVGVCYEYGNGVAQNYSEAKRWYLKAKENGATTVQEDLDRIAGKMTPTTGTLNGHDWVDLGLPSGLKWATCNVGASLPNDYGSYYSWGEISPKSNYTWSSYKWFNGSSNILTKYNNDGENGTVDNQNKLELSDDAARANWGNGWRMPTDAEMTELREQCTWTWTMQGGKNGYKVTSKKNGNSIFLPAAGYYGESRLYEVGSSGRYWPSSLYTEDPYLAWGLVFGSGGSNRHVNLRYYGFTIRPVTK